MTPQDEFYLNFFRRLFGSSGSESYGTSPPAPPPPPPPPPPPAPQNSYGISFGDLLESLYGPKPELEKVKELTRNYAYDKAIGKEPSVTLVDIANASKDARVKGYSESAIKEYADNGQNWANNDYRSWSASRESLWNARNTPNYAGKPLSYEGLEGDEVYWGYKNNTPQAASLQALKNVAKDLTHSTTGYGAYGSQWDGQDKGAYTTQLQQAVLDAQRLGIPNSEIERIVGDGEKQAVESINATNPIGSLFKSILGPGVSAARTFVDPVSTIFKIALPVTTAVISGGIVGPAGLGLSGLTASAVTGAVSGGLTAALTGQNITEGALLGSLLSTAGSQVYDAVASSIGGSTNQVVASAASNATNAGIRSLIKGDDPRTPEDEGDVLGAMFRGAYTGGISSGVSQLGGEYLSDVPLPIKQGLTSAATAKLLGGDAEKAFINGVMSSLPEAAREAELQDLLKKAYSDISRGYDLLPSSEQDLVNNLAEQDISELQDIYKDQSNGNQLTNEQLLDALESGNPSEYVNNLYTTESEARNLWRQITGEDPSAEQLSALIGKPTEQVDTQARDYTSDIKTTDAQELDDFIKHISGEKVTYTDDEKSNLIGLPEKEVQDNLEQNYAAIIDGSYHKEATRLISGALQAKGMSMSDASPEQIKTLVDSIYSNYANDISSLKAATVQDFINGNTKTLDDIQASYTTTGGWKVEIRGKPIGDWVSQEEKNEVNDLLPAGVKLATENETFDKLSASLITLSNGKTAWVVNKPAEDLPPDLEVIRPNLGTLAPDDPSSADPAAYLYTLSTLDPNKSTIDATAINAAKTVVDLISGANISPTAKEGILNTVSVTLQGTAELTKLFSDAVWSTGLVNRDNAASKIADAVGKYGASIQSASTKQQEENITKAIDNAKGFWGTLGATIKAVYDNPAGALTLIGKEAVQEIPVIAASGGVGRLALGLGSKGLAFAAASGTNAFLDSAESYGSALGETYDNIRRAGGSHDYAMSQAYKSGAQAALVTTASSLLGDAALVKRFMGDVTNVTLPVFGKEIAKQYVTEWGEEFVQNASVQYNSYGTVNWAQARTAGAIGGLLGAGTSGGILTPGAINYQLQVARDVFGNPVTVQQLLNGSVQVEPDSINTQAPIFDIKGVGVSIDNFSKVADTAFTEPTFDFNSYADNLKSLYDTGFTDSDVSDIALRVTTSPDASTLASQLQGMGLDLGDALTAANVKFDDQVTTEKEVRDAFDQYSYFNPDLQAIESFTGIKTDADLSKAVEDYVASRYTSPEEVKEFFETANYKPSQEEIDQFTGQIPDASQETAIADYAAKNTFDIEEVKAAAAQEGIILTDDQAKEYVRQAPENQAATELRTQLDPTSTTLEEATQFLRDAGFTEEQAAVAAAQFVGTTAETAAREQVASYVDPRQVTFEEAKKLFADLGYTPTDEEIRQFVSQGPDVLADRVAGEVGAYVDPRLVTEQEAKDAYAALGLTRPTQEDIAKLVGQYTQDDLTGRATANLDTAKYNSIMEQLDELAANGSNKTAEEIQAIKNDLNNQLQALGVNVTQLTSDVEQIRTDLTAAIQSAKDAGLQGDAALQSAIEAVAAEQKTNAADLLTKLGTTEEALKSQFATEIGAVTTEIGNVENRLTAAIEAAKTAGLEGDAALDAAIQSVAADLGTSKDALLSQIGKTEETLRTDFATQLAGVTTELGNVENRLTAAIDAAKAAGLQGDAALDAAIQSVAADLGTSKSELLAQLGTTEQALRSDFASQLGAVTTEIGNVEGRLRDAIAAAEAAGLSRDQAIQAGLDAVAADLGITRTDLLSQLSTSEAALKAQIAETETSLGEQIVNVRTQLSDAIAAAEAAGLSRDQAIQAGLDAVAADLGKTREDLLAQLGTSEAALRTEIAASQTALGEQITTGLEGVRTDIANAEARINERAAAYEAAGLSRDQALNAAVSDVAAQLGVTAQNLEEQIFAARTQLSEDITKSQTVLQEQIDQAATLLGKPAQNVTQADLDYINSVISGQQTTPDLTYDVNRDGRIDQKDYDYLQGIVAGTVEPPEFEEGTRWAPTGLFGEIAGLRTDLVGQLQGIEQRRAADAAAAEQARQAEAAAAAERARQAEIAAQVRAQQQKQYANVQQLYGMLQQPGALSQKVDVKAPDVVKLDQLYDWSSIFRTPQQQQFFMSPYGSYADGGEVTEEELLQIVRG